MVEYSLLIYPWKIFYISSTKWRVMCNIISVYTCISLIGIITDRYYRITQCDIPSLIIYITYISCLNNENAIVNPRGYDYFRNRWNLVILKHRRSWEYGRAPSRSNAPQGGTQHWFHFTSQSQNGYMYHSLTKWQRDRHAACAASPLKKCSLSLLLSW